MFICIIGIRSYILFQHADAIFYDLRTPHFSFYLSMRDTYKIKSLLHCFIDRQKWMLGTTALDVLFKAFAGTIYFINTMMIHLINFAFFVFLTQNFWFNSFSLNMQFAFGILFFLPPPNTQKLKWKKGRTCRQVYIGVVRCTFFARQNFIYFYYILTNEMLLSLLSLFLIQLIFNPCGVKGRKILCLYHEFFALGLISGSWNIKFIFILRL